MINIFDSAFKSGGLVNVVSMKAAPPVNIKTPKPIWDLSLIHHNRTTEQEFQSIIDEFKNMSAESYEYSRLGIYFAIEHIIDEITEIRHSFNDLITFKTSTDIFNGLFESMTNYFEEARKTKSKNFNKDMVDAEVEAIITFVEGILFLKEMAKKDPDLQNLVFKYNDYQYVLLSELEINQKALKLISPEYEIITSEQIFKAANEELVLTMTFDYSSLRYNDLERILIRVGDRETYWHVLQDQKKWDALYQDPNQALRASTVEELRTQLPEIFEQYENIKYLSFTNMFKVLVLSATIHGERLSLRNEMCPKNEAEYQTLKAYNEDKYKQEKKDQIGIYGPYLAYTQPHAITHDKLRFAAELLTSAMSVNSILNEVCGLSDLKDCLILTKHNELYDVVRKNGSDIAIIFHEDDEHLRGCSINVADLNNNNIQPYSDVYGKVKTSSFKSMSHFLREIKEPFLQEHFFGEKGLCLNLIDKRI